MSRRVVVVMSAAALAAGGLLGSALAMQGPTKISLSSESGGHHQMDSRPMGSRTGMMDGRSSSPMRSYLGWSRTMDMDRGWRHERMGRRTTMRGWSFTTLDDTADPTFNQLLGINNRGMVAGYFGSGAQGHPNKGYLLSLSRGQASFLNENVPNSVQTQVTGLNDYGVTVGFWSPQNTGNQMNANYGFYSWGGRFYNVRFPSFSNANPPVNQLLGVNDAGIAVGFYTNSAGSNYGYEYSLRGHWFRRVVLPTWMRGPLGPSLTAAAINNRGDVAGFYTPHGSSSTYAFLKLANGAAYRLAYPGATMTQAFGVNDRDEVVGAYTVGSGNNAKTYGFTWQPGHGWTSVSDPQGMGATTVNGVNDSGDLVGFYTDGAGSTHGMLVTPMRYRMPVTQPMPTMPPSMMPTTPPSMMPSPSGTPMMGGQPAPGAPASSPSMNLGNHS